MIEYNFGNLNKIQLTVRFSKPWRWWNAIWHRYNYCISFQYYNKCTHRCYCPTGESLDGRICIAGWNM